MGKFNFMGKVFIAALAAIALLGCGEDSSTKASEVVEPEFSSSSSEILSSEEVYSSSIFTEISSSSDIESSAESMISSSSSLDASSSSESVPELESSSSEMTNSSSSKAPENPERPEDPPKPPQPEQPSQPQQPKYNKILGADVSKFQEYESYGTRIYDVDGSEKDIFKLLKDHGFNAIRLKTFVSPKAAYGYAAAGCGQDSEAFGDKEHVVAYAQKVKRAGFTFLLDIHYSDVWADPDTQIIPERWRGVRSSDEMADSVYAYTFDLLTALKNVDALPDMVQVGNEITNGMLRDLPTNETNCWGDNVRLADNAVNGVMNKQQNPNGIVNTAKYLAAGSRAVKAFETPAHKIKTVFHIESPQNTTTVNWWMNAIIMSANVRPDVMAFSAYTAYQHGTPETWKTLFETLAPAYPDVEFLIAEYNGGTGKNFYNFDNSRARTHQIMEQVPRGLGAFFWEPASYGEWGAALLDWDGNTLKANPKAFDEYKILFR